MKILTNKEKKAKKHQYKMENPDIFFTREDYEIYEYKYYSKKDERMFVPEYFKEKNFFKFEKRINRYIHHFHRLVAKQEFLRKRILNLDSFVKHNLFKDQDVLKLMIKTLKFKDAIKKKESMFEVSGYVSYYKAAEEANIFAKSVLEFSALIQMATEIIDKVDPENKDKFVYDRVEDFVKKIKVGLTAAKLKYLPRISQLCNNLFR